MTILIHIIECLIFCLVMLAPLPIILWASQTLLKENEIKYPTGTKYFVPFFLWFCTQAFIAHLLGWSGFLKLISLTAIHILLLLTGLYLHKPKIKIKAIAEPFQIAGIIIVILFAVLFFKTIEQPTTDFDSLCYHLPTMANWQQDGHFSVLKILDYNTMQSINPDPNTGQVARYPFGWEATCMTTLLPFREDIMVNFLNLLCWMLLGLTLFLIAQQLGAKVEPALFSALLAMSFPLVIHHLGTMNVDLPFAVFFLTGLFSARQFSKTPNSMFLFIFLASIAMLYAIKLSAIAYSIILILYFFFQIFSEQKQNLKQIFFSKPQVITLIAGFVFFLFTGASWYLRNWIDLGNPFGYLIVELFGKTIFEGELESKRLSVTTLSNTFEFTKLQHWKTFLKQFWIQFQLPMLLLGLGSFGIFKALLTKNSEAKKTQTIALLVVAAACFYLYWNNPYTADNNTAAPQITPWLGQQMRFAFPFVFLIAPLAALGMSSFKTSNKVLVWTSVVIMILLIVQALKSPFQLTLNLGFLLFIPTLFIKQSELTKLKQSIVYIALSSLFIIALFSSYINREKNREVAYDPIYSYMKKNVAADATVAYFKSPVSYFFYDRELQRKIIFGAENVETNEEWLQELREKKCEYIVVGPLPADFTEFVPTAQAITDGEMPFEKIHGEAIDKSYTLFKINYPIENKE